MDKDEAIVELIKAFTGTLSGEVDVFALADLAKNGVDSIHNYMFNRKLKMVLGELKKKGTVDRKVGEILAKSNYGPEYGYTLLHYIDQFEHIDKGRFLAYLLDATSKNFITAEECFRFCKILNSVSLSSLYYLKQNVTKRVLYEVDYSNKSCVNELLTNDLMYESYNNGYAFSLTAHYLDKYSLSYEDESRYRNYSEKMGDIPPLDKFPEEPERIVSGSIPYRG